MKLVTMLAELDGEKCINLDRYKTRLLALARYARFSNTSTAMICDVEKIRNMHAYIKYIVILICEKKISKKNYTIKKSFL